MYKGSLFERLMPEEQMKKEYSSYEESLYSSIASNLSLIFATNVGSSQSAMEYGRPDLENVDMNMHETVKHIQKSAQISIKKFEPRLFDCNVFIDKTKLQRNEMKIFIEAFIHIDGKNKQISFGADLLRNGGVKIYKDGI